MAKSSQYTHWMQRVDVNNPQYIDIEEHFKGLLYLKADGMNTIGKPKNVYLEGYADSDRMRYYLPDDKEYANEATKITMHFLVVGDASSRQQTIDSFTEYVRKGVHRYWDNARNRELDFIVNDEIKVSDERWHGSHPYVEIEVPIQNLYGKTKQHTQSSPSYHPSIYRQSQQSAQQTVIR